MMLNDFEETPSGTTETAKNDNNIIPSLDYFEKHKLTDDDLSMEFRYLIHNFLVYQSIMMIFAKGGEGKSLFVLALVLDLLRRREIVKCIYMDMDNSTMALKNRNLDKIINEFPALQYIHRSKADKPAKDLIEMLAGDAKDKDGVLDGVLVVIDSVRDFLGGKDMNNDRDVAPLMEQFKIIRDAGATIIFLHHSTKERDRNQYKGSSSFIDSIDVAYGLKKTDNTNGVVSFALAVEKDRIPVEDTGFELRIDGMELTQGSYTIASMDEDETEFVAKIKAVLESKIDGIKQGDLLGKIGKSQDDKTSRKRLKKFDGVLWVSKKFKEMGNATVYYPYTDVPELPQSPKP